MLFTVQVIGGYMMEVIVDADSRADAGAIAYERAQDLGNYGVLVGDSDVYPFDHYELVEIESMQEGMQSE